MRQVAINIAEACELQTLQNALAEIALDSFQPLTIRVEAAGAVGYIGDDKTKARLKPLAIGQAGDDPEDELKGCGLRAVWPVHMAAEELFAALTPPKQDSLIGSYYMFLSHDLVQRVQPTDLPMALQWVEEQQPRHELSHPFRRIVDAIMLKAWEYLELPGVLEAFARAALSRLKHHDEIVEDRSSLQSKDVLTNDEKRRGVLETMVPMLSSSERDWTLPVFSSPRLAMSKDVPWMIKLQASESERTQRVWARLIERVFDWREPGQSNAVLIACQNSLTLAEAFAWLLKPIDLDSPEAEKIKADYLEEQKWRKQDQDRPLLDPPPAKRIATLLDECESGNSAAWWRLNREMTLKPDSTHYGAELESDLTVLPGWKAADTTTRARIVAAAKKYVLEQDPKTHEWLGTNTFHRPAAAGYRALRLLLQEAPDLVSTIPADAWKRWAPIILAYPIPSHVGDEEASRKLAKMAYQYAPTEIIESLTFLIDKENREHDHIFITRKVEGCWYDRLADALLIKVRDEKLKPECMGCLLSDLLDHKVDRAKKFAESIISIPFPSSGDGRSRAIVTARVLMTHAEDASWAIVWPAIQQDTEFGREVLSAVAYESRPTRVGIGQRLTENQLADLYIWLVHQYPYAEDPKYESGWVGPRESVADLRDSLLRHLKERGTSQACKEIQRIANELPELDWLKWTLLEAQNITRRRTWVPPQPADILKIASNQQERLVQNGDQLLDVLIESLKRLEAKLQGETPAAIFLWNEIGKGVYRPKNENSFSDYVKIHLDEDLKQRGVIVNREVEIRRGEGSGQGERTDIHVDAVMRGPHGEVYDSVIAIIEAKGCWNQELNRAMKTQLVDRYLKDNRCQHGLYLVGWFNCDQWDDKDRRKQRAPKLSVDEAQRQFDTQAAELSQQDMRIKALILNTALR